MTDRLVLWDFDGTLAWRPGMWSGCVMEVLDEVEAGHAVTGDQLRRALRQGFPWHAPDDPHPQLCEPAAWWELAEEIVAAALVEAGVADRRARVLAGAVRERYVDGSVGWRVYDDTLAALAAVEEAGWRNAVLSNHVPRAGRARQCPRHRAARRRGVQLRAHRLREAAPRGVPPCAARVRAILVRRDGEPGLAEAVARIVAS